MKKRLLVALPLFPLLLAGCDSDPKTVNAAKTSVQDEQTETNSNNKTEQDKETSQLKVSNPPEKNLEDSEQDAQTSAETSSDNSVKVVSDPDSIKVIVNKKRKLPDGFVPPDLRVPNVEFSFEGASEKKNMRDEAASALEAMFKKANKEGIKLFAVSGYRSYERQKTIYEGNVRAKGQAGADAVSARPGMSEHQTGLAMDLNGPSAKDELQESFGDTVEGKWVAAHAYEFGFIIRYPEGKTEQTGYTYEPWHVRYVGKQYATYLHKHGLTLEEATEKH